MKFLLVVAAVFGLASASNLRFGFQERPRDLSGDLREILDLLPTDEYLAIGRTYLNGDAEVQSVVSYLQGDDWASLVQEVGANEQWQDFKGWAWEQGVDVDSFVGTIHDLINSWEFESTDGDMGGARAFVDEIRAATPSDDIMAMINDKLSTSEDFQALYTKISSEDARNFLHTVTQMDQVQYLGQRLREFGIDVDAVIAFIYNFLGWNFIRVELM